MNQNRPDILLIEDNRDDADLTIRALKKNNIAHNLIHLKDGEEALNFLFCKGSYTGRDFYEMPKLIILDLKMPKVDGIEVLKKIKSDIRTRVIPVTVLTSSNQNNDISECYKLGANSYIVKPVEFEGYVHAISNLGLYWLLLNQTPSQL
jgi:two-component system, response regulator